VCDFGLNGDDSTARATKIGEKDVCIAYNNIEMFQIAKGEKLLNPKRSREFCTDNYKIATLERF
jgi:hypothetical protein